MRTRTALFASLLAVLVLAPASALSLSPACEEAFVIGDTDAPLKRKAELETRCLETGQPDEVARAMIHYNRGNTFLKLGQGERALEDYGAAIRLNKPGLHEAYNNRGGLLLKRGRFEEALADFDQAIRLKPGESFPHCNRGYALSRLGRHERALADFDQALRIDPGYAPAYFGRGQLREDLGQFLPAMQDYAQTLALAPDYAPAANALAWLLAACPDEKLRDGKSAVALAQKAVGLERSATHLDTLAAAQARAGMHAEAAKTQEEALGLLGAEAKAETRAEYQKRLALYRAGKPYTETKRTQL